MVNFFLKGLCEILEKRFLISIEILFHIFIVDQDKILKV